MASRLLVLGGTEEALALADWANTQVELAVTTSLAGRTKNPKQPAGRVLSGGFGGPQGLADFLRQEKIDLLVDATHPFAATMANNAVEACETAAVPRLKLCRAAWRKENGDRWIEVPDTAEAARALSGLGRRVLLSSGRQGIEAFAACRDHWFLVRMIDPPADPLPLEKREIILARGPFGQEDEIKLLEAKEIDVLVSKNSGGDATYGKIIAARRLGLPVVMIGRPWPTPGETVETLEEAIAWIQKRLSL